jgi:hypothetical protein
MKLQGKAKQRARARQRQAERNQHGPAVPNSEDRALGWARRGNRLSANVARSNEAVTALERAVEINPDDPHTRLRLAFVLLRQGQYERAWPQYRIAMFDPSRGTAVWSGEDLSGLSIAIRLPRGPVALGEWVFAVRYVHRLAQVGAVVMEVPSKFRTLAFNWSEVAEIVHEGDRVPHTDFETTPMLIPAWMGTTLETIPPGPYVTAAPERVEHWRQRLHVDGGKRLVAIGWSGGSAAAARAVRSIPLSHIERLLAVPGVRFVSIERFLDADVATRLADRFDFVHVGGEVSDDMGEMAAVLTVCDQTISIDNSAAHLAGALARPMKLLLTDGGAGGEWRWHCAGRECSPWYPTARPFRRSLGGDWSPIVDRVMSRIADKAISARTEQVGP